MSALLSPRFQAWKAGHSLASPHMICKNPTPGIPVRPNPLPQAVLLRVLISCVGKTRMLALSAHVFECYALNPKSSASVVSVRGVIET